MLPKFSIRLRKFSDTAFENAANIFYRTNPGLRARFILAGLIALLFTARVLQWSFNYGRLAYDVTYDDIGYFLDAYSRIKTFYEQGAGALLAGLYHNPPHSPYSSLLAFAGFALFGPADWAPYFMNVITVLIFLGFLTYVFRNVHFIIYSILIILVLFVPFSFYAVHEFKPDFITGLFSCMFTFLALESFLYFQDYDRFKLRFAGLIFGLALLSKPSFFAHTFALSFLVPAIAISHQLLFNHKQWQAKAKTLVFISRDFFLPGIVLAAPLYAMNWRNIWHYFWTNTRGEMSNVYNFKGGFWDVWKAFTFDGPNSWMISSYIYIFTGIVSITICFMLYKRKWQELYFVAGLMVVALTSLGIIVYGRHNNMFFGLTYQLMLCIVAYYSLASFYGNKLGLCILLSVFLIFSGWYITIKPLPKIFNANQTQLALKENSANRKILKAIEVSLNEPNWSIAPVKIFIAFAGEVNAYTLKWLALQNSVPVEFFDLYTQSDMNVYLKAIGESKFVIVSDEKASGIYWYLPSFKMQKPVLDFLRSQPDMKEILTLQTNNNIEDGCIRLFASKAKSSNNIPGVALPYNAQGFLPPEGPYPQWKLPLVRWGIFPESQIVLPDRLSGKIKLILSARSKPGTKLLLTLNETEVYRHVFSGDAFEDIDTTISVTPGVKILHFKYDGIDNNVKDKLSRAVLFQDIRITAPETRTL